MRWAPCNVLQIVDERSDDINKMSGTNAGEHSCRQGKHQHHCSKSLQAFLQHVRYSSEHWIRPALGCKRTRKNVLKMCYRGQEVKETHGNGYWYNLHGRHQASTKQQRVELITYREQHVWHHESRSHPDVDRF